MKVLKFGSTSLVPSEGLKNVRAIIERQVNSGSSLLVVASAFGDTTEKLREISCLAAQADASYRIMLEALKMSYLEIAGEYAEGRASEQAIDAIEQCFLELADLLRGVSLIREASPRTLDLVVSSGEILSARLLSGIISAGNTEAELIDARLVLKSDSSFGQAVIDQIATLDSIRQAVSKTKTLYIVAGNVASSSGGELTTLGNGGSDYTAALFAAALQAEELEIWTRVNGFMTADPERVSKAFTISALTYAEAMELSHFGATELFSPRMEPAVKAKVPVRIRNTFRPDFAGSFISETPVSDQFSVTGVSSISDIALLTVQENGTLGNSVVPMRLFAALSREEVDVLLIAQASSEHSICIAVHIDEMDRARRVIEAEFERELQRGQIAPVMADTESCIIAVVGSNMIDTPGIAGKLFQALGKNGVNVTVIAQGSSELNISAIISRSDEAKALNALHDSFFLSEYKTINLYLVGVGWVGGALLRQLQQQSKVLKERKIDFRVVAIANSRHMLFDTNGIEISSWKEQLENSQTTTDIDDYIRRMKGLNLPNSIFVDCTSSDYLAFQYESILRASISVVTPNKKANSGPFDVYERLKHAASRANVKYFYETNVGAGLPVISTLNDLIASGDEIIRIEAVLSGTLSFIFNSFTEGRRFSEIVKEAKSRGYTEPDPRDDLSGLDVVRKLLILTREMGIALEEREIEVESLVPPNARQRGSIDEFFAELEKLDAEFEAKRASAAKKKHKLCYIGTIEGKCARVSLKEVDENHPFYALSGSDNVISFVTKRYFERPLVVKGPGAGDDVTAAGVFADILRVASYL